MADTQRTRAAILALFTDNTTGAISEQDLRDFVVTLMEQDFANPGDFWTEPRSAVAMNDKTVRGWIEYSQIIRSDISFGRTAYLHVSGWAPASLLTSGQNGLLAIAANSYGAGESQAQMLRRGVICDSAMSARFSGQVGAFVYLMSGSALGSISVQIPTGSIRIVGYVEPSAIGDTSSIKWRFDPTWAVSGS